MPIPILSPVPVVNEYYHHDYSALRSPILSQSILCPIYCIFQTAEFLEDFHRTLFPLFQFVPWIMAALLGGGDGGMGQIGQFPLEQWFFEMPPCTRYWTTATVITSILIQCKVLTPFQLFYSFRSVYYKSQVRRPCSLPWPLANPITSTGDYSQPSSTLARRLSTCSSTSSSSSDTRASSSKVLDPLPQPSPGSCSTPQLHSSR